MSELTDFMRSGAFIKSYTAMQSSGPEKGIIYTEDASDRLFWENVVNKACPGRYDIKPFGSPGSQGKRGLEKEYGHLHQDRLIAVDGDFDYICPRRNEYASHLADNPFVLHTFFYSRECHISTCESLTDIINRIYLHVRSPESISEAILSYSRVIYPALILFSFLHNSDQPVYREDDFSAVIKIPDGACLVNADMTVNEVAIAGVRRNVEEFCSENAHHIEEAGDEYTEHTDTLCRLGVTHDNAYLFTNGHKVLKSLVVPVLQKLSRERQEQDKSWVRDSFSDNSVRDRINQVINYYKTNCNVDFLVSSCEAYKNQEFWRRITEKLKSAAGRE